MKLKDFFYFNRSDRAVLLFFLCLAVVSMAFIFIVGGDGEDTVLETEDTLSRRESPYSSYRSHANRHYIEAENRQVERFAFDPNTADSTELLRLGLHYWQVRNIYKYRAAGGVYRRPADFARLYGLTRKQYRELEPYIHISSDYAPAAGLFAEERHERRDTTHRYLRKLKVGEQLDLNLSDTTALQRVPGIGPYFAGRIVRYRQRLGGFYSARQLEEIEDFPKEAIFFFHTSNNIHKINVNMLKLNELKRHPYINYYQAKAIMDYRRLRGPLHSLDELRLLKDFTAEDIARLQHYVIF